MESKAKREFEAAGGGDAATDPAPPAPVVAPAATAVAGEALAKCMPVQRSTADIAPQQAVVAQAAAVRADAPAPPPLFSQPSHCKSCSDISARLEALQVTAPHHLTPRALA